MGALTLITDKGKLDSLWQFYEGRVRWNGIEFQYHNYWWSKKKVNWIGYQISDTVGNPIRIKEQDFLSPIELHNNYGRDNYFISFRSLSPSSLSILHTSKLIDTTLYSQIINERDKWPTEYSKGILDPKWEWKYIVHLICESLCNLRLHIINVKAGAEYNLQSEDKPRRERAVQNNVRWVLCVRIVLIIEIY